MRAPLDRHKLGRQLSVLARATPMELMRRAEAGPPTAQARRIGLTGAPGAGKSTLAGHLALQRSRDARVGVLAIDPSSPRSGGAILGDRIRMDELQGSTDLYIRSIGSQSSSDGLSDNLPELLDLMDRHGFDEVILETVGVGQAEYAARIQVDTLVLVLLPDSGDTVQAMKAGIMEMADVFVVNKADLPGARRMATDIQRIAAISRRPESAWRAPVLLASSQQPESVLALSEAIDRHQKWLAEENRSDGVRDARARYRLRRLIERRVGEVVSGLGSAVLTVPLAEQISIALSRIAGTTPAAECSKTKETEPCGDT